MKKTSQLKFEIPNASSTHAVLTKYIRVTSPNEKFSIPLYLQSDLFLSLFEAIQNVFHHAAQKKNVRVELEISSRWIEARIFDQGTGFEGVRSQKITKFAERGRGLRIIKSLNDEVFYKKGKKENCLIIRKKIVPASQKIKTHELLYEISRKLAEAPNLQRIYDIILENLLRTFNASRASIMLYDPQESALKIVAARGIPDKLLEKIRVKKGEGISGEVFEKSKPILIKDASRDLQKKGKEKGKYHSQSFISAPMIASPYRVGEQTLGVVNVTDRLDGSGFTSADLKLLSILASQAAAYIQIGNLIEELKVGESIRRDYQIVQEIQQKLPPQEMPFHELCKSSGALWIAEQGGGDYFDAWKQEDALWLMIADVSGHSIVSALTMANFRSTLRALRDQYDSPASLLTQINRRLFEDLNNANQFICVNMVKLHPAQRKFVYCGAGCPPLVKFKAGKILDSFPSQNIPLGVNEEEIFEEQREELLNGEGLGLYSDGAMDLKNPLGVKLGLENFWKMFEKLHEYPRGDSAHSLLKLLKNYSQSSFPNDDVTLLVANLEES